jgi:hypothetical protein
MHIEIGQLNLYQQPQAHNIGHNYAVNGPIDTIWGYEWIAKKIDEVYTPDYFDSTKIDGGINSQSKNLYQTCTSAGIS